jgi:hypothetical protein
MRGIAVWLVVLLLSAGVLAETPQARIPLGALGDRNVSVTNRSQHSAVELYISPQSADAWGPDRLGETTLDAGVQRPIALGKMRDCGFDVLIVYDDLTREDQRGLNFCKLKQVVFDGSHAVLPPDALGPVHNVTIIDVTQMPLQQLFISPQDAAQWGDDLLSAGAMSVNENRVIAFRGPCAADVRVVFANRAAEERRGVDLCSITTLRIAPGWTTTDLPNGTP